MRHDLLVRRRLLECIWSVGLTHNAPAIKHTGNNVLSQDEVHHSGYDWKLLW